MNTPTPAVLSRFPEAVKAAIKETRRSNQDVIIIQPDRATTKGQMDLMKKHGSPRVFARACINAIGDISLLESITAIEKYRREWDAA